MAEGDKQSNILQAEGARQSAILRAEGFALALDQINNTANHADPRTMTLQYLDALKQIGASPSTKWILPMEVTNLLATVVGQAGRAFANGQPPRPAVGAGISTSEARPATEGPAQGEPS